MLDPSLLEPRLFHPPRAVGPGIGVSISIFRLIIAKSCREAQDAEILNARADSPNREALDVLEYQDLA